jgi:hypothetical protein
VACRGDESGVEPGGMVGGGSVKRRTWPERSRRVVGGVPSSRRQRQSSQSMTRSSNCRLVDALLVLASPWPLGESRATMLVSAPFQTALEAAQVFLSKWFTSTPAQALTPSKGVPAVTVVGAVCGRGAWLCGRISAKFSLSFAASGPVASRRFGRAGPPRRALAGVTIASRCVTPRQSTPLCRKYGSASQ